MPTDTNPHANHANDGDGNGERAVGTATGRRYAAAALIYALTLAYLLLRWDVIPDPVPTHFNARGEADGFKPKSVLSAAGLVVMGVLITLVMPLSLPPRRIARQTFDANHPTDANHTTDVAAIPFSETAARRVETLHAFSAELLSKIVLAMAICMCVSNISAVIPDVPIPFWADSVLWFGFVVYVIALVMRIARNPSADIEPDDAEQIRNQRLRLQGGAGLYNEPRDPMAAAVLPSDPGKISLNMAHPPGRRYLWGIGVMLAAIIGGSLALAFWA